jgi:chorismate synthase
MNEGDAKGMLGEDPRSFRFGEEFKVRVFGTSHGPQIGVEIEGCPEGIEIGQGQIQRELDRRKPGQSAISTQRSEEDSVIIESGIANGETTGEKIRMLIKNRDADSSAYEAIRFTPRPGHADFPARAKYGMDADLSGGAFFSGRMTACMVMAGAVAKAIIAKRGIEATATAIQIGKIKIERIITDDEIRKNTFGNPVRAAAPEIIEEMATEIGAAKAKGDSVGGVIECRIFGVPAGAGNPMFRSVESRIASAMFAIPAVKGIEFGSGFEGAKLLGSQNNDEFVVRHGRVKTKTNNAGGILGGLATGMPIVFRVAIKPASSIAKEQKTVDLRTVQPAKISVGGRHDPCIVPRAVSVVENVAAIVIADILLGGSNGRD